MVAQLFKLQTSKASNFEIRPEKKAMFCLYLVLVPIPHRKHMDSMCSKCPINSFNIQTKQANNLGLETWPKFKFYKLVIGLGLVAWTIVSVLVVLSVEMGLLIVNKFL